MCKNSVVFSKRIFIGFLAQISAERPTLFSSMIAWCKHVPMFFCDKQLVESISENYFNFSQQNLFGIFIKVI